VLAVDNLSGGKVAGRIITVNHVDNYKIKRAEVCSNVASHRYLACRVVSHCPMPVDDAHGQHPGRWSLRSCAYQTIVQQTGKH
jgi:hypothetical protein